MDTDTVVLVAPLPPPLLYRGLLPLNTMPPASSPRPTPPGELGPTSTASNSGEEEVLMPREGLVKSTPPSGVDTWPHP